MIFVVILLLLLVPAYAREVPVGNKQTVDDSFSGASDVTTADVDGDGDLDVLGAASSSGEISWFENQFGDGGSWIQRLVVSETWGARSVSAADIDGDGDLDVLGATNSANDVIWWENTAGDGSAWSEQSVDNYFAGVVRVVATDMDGDGDMDVLGAAYEADDVSWWENTSGG